MTMNAAITRAQDSAFVVICTISASRTHITVIGTRMCVSVAPNASENMRPRVSGNFGGAINFSVTFVALPYDLLR